MTCPSENSTTITGYHGTDETNVDLIEKNNFKLSTNDREWLGHGVYFFVEGVSDPLNNACEWAKNQAYNKGNYAYENYSVIEVKVTCENVLDTTTIDGLKAYDALRNSIISKHDEHFLYNRDKLCDDRVMWNLIASFMEADIVIHNLYIKNKVQRKKRISSNVPNCTVMCVKSSNLIDSSSIKVAKKGGVA
ncbi:TPA: hypothetical protein ACQJO2_003346 [Vibrio parahaemolyticus]